MNRSLLSVLFVFRFIEMSTANCGTRNVFHTRITKGQGATDNEFPWQVSIQEDGLHYCGAAIVSQYWIVSAAHCFVPLPRRPQYAIVGTIDNQDKHHSYRVAAVIPHEHFKTTQSGTMNDIALLRTEEPIQFSRSIQPVCFPNDPDLDTSTLEDCWVSGWGYTSTETYKIPRYLQKLALQVLDPEICFLPEEDPLICTANINNIGASTCMGDSGSPLACQDKKTQRWLLTGIVSFGTKSCNMYSVFTKVAPFVNWIRSKAMEEKFPIMPDNTPDSTDSSAEMGDEGSESDPTDSSDETGDEESESDPAESSDEPGDEGSQSDPADSSDEPGDEGSQSDPADSSDEPGDEGSQSDQTDSSDETGDEESESDPIHSSDEPGDEGSQSDSTDSPTGTGTQGSESNSTDSSAETGAQGLQSTGILLRNPHTNLCTVTFALVLHRMITLCMLY
nr:PREDICTED: serine protease 55-like isoform X2 [Latimeria chalumnae]|eukprot:XP_014345811.1 PREDICTED: serine protease 55-like isoform X2 [Latimeria chalumnae]